MTCYIFRVCILGFVCEAWWVDGWASWCFNRNGRKQCRKLQIWNQHPWRLQQTESRCIFWGTRWFHKVVQHLLRLFFSKNMFFIFFWILDFCCMLRRKYELHQFVNNELPLCCHYPTSTTATHSRSSSCSSQSGSEKKHYKKQTTTRMHGLGSAFRYSWRREHKTTKKSNSMVTVWAAIMNLITQESAFCTHTWIWKTQWQQAFLH